MSGQDIQLRLVIGADGAAAVTVVKQTSGEVDKLADAQKRVAASNKDASGSAADYAAELRKQLRMLQDTTAQHRELEARMRGATQSQLTDVRALGAQIDALTAKSTQFAGVAGGVSGLLANWVAPAALIASVIAFTNALTEARLQVEKLNATQLFANGGDLAAAGRDIAFVKERANALGLEFLVVANSWGKFNAAARGSALAGEGAREVFDSILKASTALRLSSSETEGALLAVQQMMSKGNVQAEELRGQLGERLPGAFGIAARSMGVTEKELNKLLETGKVLATDFLPKFAAQLTKELGDTPQKAAEGTQGALNRLSNAFVDLKQEASQLGGPNAAVGALTTLFDNLAQSIRVTRAESGGLFMQIANGYNTVKRFIEGGGSETEAGKLREGKIAAQELVEKMRELVKVRAEFADAPARQGQIDRQLALLGQQYAKFYGATTALGRDALAIEGEQYRDRAELAGKNKTLIQGLFDSRKASDEQYLKDLAATGNKQAKLRLAMHEIDEKYKNDSNRTEAEIAALRADATKKIYGGDTKQAAQAHYAELIAREEGFQKSLEKTLKDETETLKFARDQGVITETEYYQRLGEIRIIGQAQYEESVNREVAAARDAVARGDQAKKKDFATYLAQQKEFGNQRLKIEVETNEATAAAQRKAFAEELARRTRQNSSLADLAQSRRDAAVSNAEELEQKQFELSLLGEEELTQQRLQAQRQIELQMRRQLTAAQKEYNKALEDAIRDGASPSAIAAITASYNDTTTAIRAGAAANRDVTLSIINQSSALNDQKQFWDGFFQSIKGGWKGVRDYLKNFFFDWLLKQLSQQFVMNVAVSGSGGAGGGVGGIVNGLGSLFGGGGSGSIGGSLFGGALGSLGTLGGVIGMGGSGILGALGAGYSLGAAGATAGGLAGATGAFGLATSAGGIAGVAGGIGSVVGSVISMIPVVGWIAIAAYAAFKLFGHDKEPGFKIDNNLTNVGNPSSHFTPDSLSPFDYSGRGVDPAVYATLTKAINTIDDLLVKDLLSGDVINKIRQNINSIQNETSWQHLDKEGIEKGTKEFLIKRYGAVFDEVDPKIAASIRGFTGTSEELLKFLGGVLGVMQTLKTNADAFKAVIGESLSLGQLTALQKEGESLADTLTRVVGVFQSTTQIAEIMGKGADAFGAVGLASLEARERLVTLAGGLQSLSSGVSFYLEKFFTDEERAALARKQAQAQLESGFAALGMAIPTSRAQFVALVKGIDLSTEAGQKLFVALMALAPALDTVLKVASEPRKGRLQVAADPLTGKAETSQFYSDNFLTETQRRAQKFAESTQSVNDTFGHLGIAIPKTRAEFKALVDSCDLTTASGRMMYNILMGIAPAFADITEAAQSLVQMAINIGGVLESGTQLASDRLSQLFAIIDSTGESAQVKMQRKLAATTALAAELDAAYNASVARNGGNVLADSLAIKAARDAVLAQQAGLAGDLALFTVLQAQYGALADQMFSLEKWHQEQIALANGNANQLLLIEQSYAERRNAILTGGVSTGLGSLSATIQAWINSLLLNSSLTTLTPQQQLDESRRQYETALQSGDANAITRAADAYLQQARSFYASGAQYAAIFAAVLAQMQALANGQNVPVVPTPNVPVVGGSGGNFGGGGALQSRAAAASAASAERAANVATQALATIMAAVKFSIDDEGEANRASREASTKKIVDALAPVGNKRVAV